jgi:hypothetical protein
MGHGIKLGQVYSNPFVKAFKPQTESPQSVSVQIKEESEDHEVGMANSQLDYIIKSANELKGKLGSEEKEIPGWIQDHISKAHSYLHQANSGYHEYDDTEDMNEEKISFKKLKKGDILVGKFPPYKEMEVISSTDKSAKVKSSKGAVIDIYSTNNYELKEQSMKLTKIINEQNASFNKWLLKFVDDYISGGEFSKGSPQFQWALATLLSATLTDANFHQAAKKAKTVFRKAEEPDNSDQMEQLIKMKASDISKKAKWDGHAIIDGFAYVTAMRIGGPAMGNVTALKNESKTEVKEDVSPRIARGKDTGDLIVQIDGKEYVIGFSADGYKNPYRIWPPKNDTGYDINKNATGKKLWAKMKPMVDKYLASKNEIFEVSVNSYSISEYRIIESDYKFGEVEYTLKNMTPNQIQDISVQMNQTPIAKLAGKNIDSRIRVARDLGRLLGKNPMNPNEKGKESALLLQPYKNKLIDTGEYKQIYTDLMNKLKKISSSLQKGSVGDSSSAKAAARADIKKEF